VRTLFDQTRTSDLCACLHVCSSPDRRGRHCSTRSTFCNTCLHFCHCIPFCSLCFFSSASHTCARVFCLPGSRFDSPDPMPATSSSSSSSAAASAASRQHHHASLDHMPVMSKTHWEVLDWVCFFRIRISGDALVRLPSQHRAHSLLQSNHYPPIFRISISGVMHCSDLHHNRERQRDRETETERDRERERVSTFVIAVHHRDDHPSYHVCERLSKHHQVIRVVARRTEESTEPYDNKLKVLYLVDWNPPLAVRFSLL
jgi:hypothetical protein